MFRIVACAEWETETAEALQLCVQTAARSGTSEMNFLGGFDTALHCQCSSEFCLSMSQITKTDYSCGKDNSFRN